ncbi:cell wall-active antibiotic response 4TMS protein YvqF [Nonomuraea polychroma]|uniref:Cell wall-active antibiotic response 4TMS protein YvqF n=1 Tax=Nonomuraea polychroma TaxID=46176 RepID=A0A438MG95_9ACTN|nr:cell wall-active antibiotic response 4TMS protein YvqF [Nonomuraea polychroma]
MPKLQEVGERLAEEFVSARRLPAAGDVPPPHELRASDADRERIAQVLQDAHADGRLTLEELEERLGVLYAARTLGELAQLTGDLLPADQQPLNLDGRPVSAIFKQEQRGGRWVVPAELTVTAMFGTTKLDLRDAILQNRRIIINATLVFGGLEIHVPEDLEVIRVAKGKTVRLNKQPTEPGAPVVEVRTTNFAGDVKVKEPPRRKRRR